MLAGVLGFALVANVAHAEDIGRATPTPPPSTPAPEAIAAAFEAALDNHNPGRAAVFLAEDARALVPNPLQGRNAITQFLIGRYAADTSSAKALDDLAEITGSTHAYDEKSMSSASHAARNAVGRAGTQTHIDAYARIALAPWFILGGVLPLGFLFWRRSL